MTTIQELKEAHKGEWLAIVVLREGESGPEEASWFITARTGMNFGEA